MKVKVSVNGSMTDTLLTRSTTLKNYDAKGDDGKALTIINSSTYEIPVDYNCYIHCAKGRLTEKLTFYVLTSVI